MKQFFDTIRNSIFGPAFYAELPHAGVRRALNYLFGLCLIFAIITILRIIPVMFTLISEKTILSLIQQYPQGLQLHVVKGNVSINQPEPLFVGQGIEDNGTKHLFVIDTKTPFTGDQIDTYSTEILVKKDFVVYKSDGQTKVVPLTDIDDFTLTQARLEGWEKKVAPFLMPFAIAMVVLTFAGILVFGFIFKALYFAFPAGVIYLAYMLKKQKIVFKNAYKIALYAGTFAFITDLIVIELGGRMLPFSFTALTLLIALLNLSKIKTHSAPAEHAHSEPGL